MGSGCLKRTTNKVIHVDALIVVDTDCHHSPSNDCAGKERKPCPPVSAPAVVGVLGLLRAHIHNFRIALAACSALRNFSCHNGNSLLVVIEFSHI